MRLLLLNVVWFCAIANATDFYVGPSKDSANSALTYGTGTGASYANQWAGCAAITGVSAGDTVYLDDERTWYEKCDLAISGSTAGRISVKGRNGNYAEFEHTISLDGDDSFTGQTTWSTTGGAWSNVSGEVYKKNFAAFTYMLIEDGEKITPYNCASDSEAAVVAAIQRGQWCINTTPTPDVIYYRSSDGSAPASHSVRVVARNDEAGGAVNKGVVSCKDQSFLNIDYISVTYHLANFTTTEDVAGVSLNNCNNVTVNNIQTEYVGSGVAVNGGVGVVVGPDLSILRSLGTGLTVEGLASNVGLTIKGGTLRYSNNDGIYSGGAVSYSADGDGIGIGHGGGTGEINIYNVDASYNGSPDANADAGGSGIYVGTGEASNGFRVSVFGSQANYNKGAGIYLDDWIGGTISGNEVIGNVRGGSSPIAAALYANPSQAFFTGGYINNNWVGWNCAIRGQWIRAPAAGTLLTVANNVYVRNANSPCGTTGTFSADLSIDSLTGMIESNNRFYAYDTSKVIVAAGSTYTSTQIGDGTWDAVGAGVGANTTYGDPDVRTLPSDPHVTAATMDLYPNTGSVLLNTGLSVPIRYDAGGGKCSGGTADIGIYCNDMVVPYGYILHPNKRVRN